jgi:hypothetical protein
MVNVNMDGSGADRLALAVPAQYRMATTEQLTSTDTAHQVIGVDGGGEGAQQAVRLGAWLDNNRRRAGKLSAERRPWSGVGGVGGERVMWSVEDVARAVASMGVPEGSVRSPLRCAAVVSVAWRPCGMS